ncbi:sugar phosphate isomerase/epimerase [Olivibacter sp. CPCC 100613]|uniref:sugar phosphate isomerase/epimerase family protein n=1 Tax=Olivibacter sp. CPCC 100613 TaxID=3079931 RepID=UPI002FF6A4A0
MKRLEKNLMSTFFTICFILYNFYYTAAQSLETVKTDWKLAIQSYTFHKFTLMETLDKVQNLGIHYLEVYPGQPLGAGFADLTFLPRLSKENQERLNKEAAKRGIKIIATGVVVVSDASEWESYFSFAQAMGMEYITAEPALADWDRIEQLVKKYNIKLAVHNHPKPSLYWNPKDLLIAIAQRDPRIGSCADVGHWRREGLNSLECLEKLKGRIQSLHFKDIALTKASKHEEMPDTIWGTGILDVKAMLYALKKQHFKGTLAIEYENNWDNSVPDIQKNLAYYQQALKEINP